MIFLLVLFMMSWTVWNWHECRNRFLFCLFVFFGVWTNNCTSHTSNGSHISLSHPILSTQLFNWCQFGRERISYRPNMVRYQYALIQNGWQKHNIKAINRTHSEHTRSVRVQFIFVFVELRWLNCVRCHVRARAPTHSLHVIYSFSIFFLRTNNHHMSSYDIFLSVPTCTITFS